MGNLRNILRVNHGPDNFHKQKIYEEIPPVQTLAIYETVLHKIKFILALILSFYL